MKKLILALLCVASFAQAKGNSFPEIDFSKGYAKKVTAQVPVDVIRGSTLMIQSNKPLTITKDQQLTLDKELGESKRNQFYTEMVMEKSVSQLKSKYASVKRPMTTALISKYQSLLQNNMKLVPKVGSL